MSEMSVDKKYLDLDGLKTYTNKVKELVDEKLTSKVDKPAGTLNTPLGAYKIRTDANGLVVETQQLALGDLENSPTIGAGTLTLQVNNTTVGTFNANASDSSTINIKLGDFGLASAMRFVGTSTTDPTDSSGATIEGYQTFQAGDVCLYKNTSKEYVYNGTIWLELGDEGSYALKTVSITVPEGGGLEGGGTLADSRTISHAKPDGAAVTPRGAYTIATDKFGHVTQTRELEASTSSAGNHTHSVSGSGTITVPKVSATSNKKLSLSVKDANFLSSVKTTTANLATTSITPAVAGGTIKPAVAVEEANRPTKTVYSTVTASKATEGDPITYGTANRAETSTNVGNANLGKTGPVAINTKVNGKIVTDRHVYDVSYDEGAACLTFTALGLETAEITQAATSTTYIYGAETSKTTFTPYTFADVTASNITANTAVDVAKAGTAVNIATVGTAVDVATGRLSPTAAGDSLLTAINPESAKAVTTASIVDTEDTGVAFVSDITISSENKNVDITGSASEAGAHTHPVTLS